MRWLVGCLINLLIGVPILVWLGVIVIDWVVPAYHLKAGTVAADRFIYGMVIGAFVFIFASLIAIDRVLRRVWPER